MTSRMTNVHETDKWVSSGQWGVWKAARGDPQELIKLNPPAWQARARASARSAAVIYRSLQ